MPHPHRSTMRRRRQALLALTLAGTVLLSGCVGFGARTEPPTPMGGTGPAERKASAAVAELTQLPGVVDAFVTTGPTGLPSQIELSTGLNLDAGYAGDLPALLDYTLAQAWSVTVEEPTTMVSVGFLSGDTALDLAPVAAELGWPGRTGPKLDLSVDDMAERYGPWPGPVPERPAELG